MRNSDTSSSSFVFTFFVLAVVFAAIAIIVFLFGPSINFLGSDSFPISAFAILVSSVFATLTLVLHFRRYLAYLDWLRQTKLAAEGTRSKDRASQYKEGAQLLESEKQSLKIGGVHLLCKVAELDSDYYEPVSQVLCSFIQEECSETFTFLSGRIFTALDEKKGYVESHSRLETSNAAIAALNALGYLGTIYNNYGPRAKLSKDSIILYRVFLSSKTPITGSFIGICFRDIIVGNILFREAEFSNTLIQATVLDRLEFDDIGARNTRFSFPESPSAANTTIQISRSDLTRAKMVVAPPTTIAVHESQVDGLSLVAKDAQVTDSWYQHNPPALIGATHSEVFYCAPHKRPTKRTRRGFLLHERSKPSIALRKQANMAGPPQAAPERHIATSSKTPTLGQTDALPTKADEPTELFARVSRFLGDASTEKHSD